MNEGSSASAPGKIILSGEYAVVFGKRGIAVPSQESVTVTWTKDTSLSEPIIVWEGGVHTKWIEYVGRIFGYLLPFTGPQKGTLLVQCDIPLGKGMGSSTSLVIAVCRALLGSGCGKIALGIEDEINPGHSGIDFAVIWEAAPILYQRGKEPQIIDLPRDILKHAKLVDSGKPNETTRELVAWMKNKYSAAGTPRPGSEEMIMNDAIHVIGSCTERLLKGESLHAVMRDHHKAQLALGIVPDSALKIIEQIESEGGSAKVIGAGGRTGGGGMVLCLPAQAQ